MFAGVTFSSVVLVAVIYFIFRKPIKTTVNQANNVLPEVIAAAADAAVNSATSAAYVHRKELDQQLQDEHGVTLDEVRQLYAAMAVRKSKPSPKQP